MEKGHQDERARIKAEIGQSWVGSGLGWLNPAWAGSCRPRLSCYGLGYYVLGVLRPRLPQPGFIDLRWLEWVLAEVKEIEKRRRNRRK